ncbi:MAG: M48 family metallopeptidase [Thiotrichales bacterium]|nr:M48 family metallopeptidase [Thiotrichales bacterium]
MHFTLGNHELEIIKTTRRGSIGLRVEPNRIALMVPKQLADAAITAFVESEQGWLLQQIEAHQSQMPKQLVMKSGYELLLFGDKVMFKEDHHTPVKKMHLTHDDTCITVFCKQSRALKNERHHIYRHLVDFYHQQLIDYLTPKVADWEKRIGVQTQSVQIKNYRSRWGSCYSDGRVQFNWKLVMAPKAVIDYVVVHELCHLVHANHSAAFWDLVEQHCPDFETHKAWLKENGAALISFQAA